MMKYVFEDITVDPSTREVFASGNPVDFEPKVLDLLIFLIEQRHRVVSKEDLVEAIWNGRAISDAAISSAVSAARKAIGDDGRRQEYLKTMHGRGLRFVASVVELRQDGEAGANPPDASRRHEQEIHYCHSADGTRLAYALAGSGPPLVKAANWLHHLEFDWQSPVWRHYFEELTSRHRLLRYDGRGMGLSSWNVTDFSLERQVEDLSAVIDAAGFDRFPIIALSQGCAKAVVYATRNPERVSKLVLIGGYSQGWKRRGGNDGAVMRKAAIEMIRAGWGSDNPAVRQMFTTLYMPDAPPESQRWFSDLQRKTTSPENAAATLDHHGDVDVGDQLALVKAPTLVIHSRNDGGVPFEQGQDLAAGIPGARFAVLDSANHVLPTTDPAWDRCAQLIQDFLTE
ncbi:alpha/beta fold hydrolase [Oricola sp.]|uniref:alpha/beta fold hydrolase n=1 Tax=Oricola sp. TaxID=1979950 RepID=UPI003BA8B172